VYNAVDKLDGTSTLLFIRKRNNMSTGVTYAIKRIKFIDFMNSTSKFDRALREVKALARLDHHHMIRYYNAWLEIDDLFVSDDQWEANSDQQEGLDSLKKSIKRPKIKEVKEGEHDNSMYPTALYHYS